MCDFFKWAFHHQRPVWVSALAIIALVSVWIVAVIITGVALATGYWFVAILVWIAAPIYLLVREYAKDTQEPPQ